MKVTSSSREVTTIYVSNKELKERLLDLIRLDKTDVNMTLNNDEGHFFLKYTNGDKNSMGYSVGD